MTDVYSPPQADLQPGAKSSGQHGSIEKAIAGDYDVETWESIKEAWNLLKGVKASFWGGVIIYYFIITIAVYVPAIVMAVTASTESSIIINIWTILATLATYPMSFGLMMLGVKRSVKQPVSFTIIFEYYSKIIPIILLLVFAGLLVMIGLILLVIPGIYLGISYMFALPLLLDKKMGIWEAMETSRKAVTKNWFKILVFFIVLGFFMNLGIFVFLIGVLWSVPLGCVAYGVMYRNIFGVSEA